MNFALALGIYSASSHHQGGSIAISTYALTCAHVRNSSRSKKKRGDRSVKMLAFIKPLKCPVITIIRRAYPKIFCLGEGYIVVLMLFQKWSYLGRTINPLNTISSTPVIGSLQHGRNINGLVSFHNARGFQRPITMAIASINIIMTSRAGKITVVHPVFDLRLALCRRA